MNPGKHTKNWVQEWLEETEDDSTIVPTHSRGSHVLGAYVKINKPAVGKARRYQPPAPPKADGEMMREPGGPPKVKEQHSQTASWDHLRKLDRLPQLRAPLPARRSPSPPKPAPKMAATPAASRRNRRPPGPSKRT
jgi:hypothetical protein